MFTKSRLFCLLFIGLGFALQAQQQKNWQILFDFDKHHITAEGASLLAEVVGFMDKVECTEIVLQGHTDWIGSLAYNQALSTNRTRAVRDHLMDLGVPENLLQIAWFGEEKPQADNVSDEGRQLNRRVEVVVTYVQKQEVVLEVIEEEEEEKVEPLPSEPVVEDLRLQLDARNKAEFTYDCRGDIIIAAKEGAKVRIPEGMLVDCDEAGEISVEVKEFTDMNTIIKSQVSTYSGNTMLQSAGMILVDLKRDGKKVNMSGCMEVTIPGPKVEGMRPYYTNRISNPRRINWRKRKGSVRYDDLQQAYILEICGEVSSSFGINCDKPTRGKGFLVKVKNLRGENPPLAVVAASGAVTNMRLVSKRVWRRHRVAYYTFPIIEDEPLKIIGAYKKDVFLGKKESFNLNEDVYYDSKKGRLKSKWLRKLSKQGTYRLIKDFPKLRFEKTS